MPNIHDLIDAVLLNPDIVPAIQSAGDDDGDWLDMQDHEMCLFVLSLGVATATGTLNGSIEQTDTAVGGNAKALSPAKAITELTGVDDDSVVAIGVRQGDLDHTNGFRWIRFAGVVATDDMTYGVTSLRFGGRRLPESNVT